MSLDSLPDEVLVKILHEPFINDDPISTSIEAHEIYQAYLVSRDQKHTEECLTSLSTQCFTQRRPVLSALLLGVCKRWYRLGCPLFYRYNTFAVMYYDLATFAKQIGVHNSVFLREVNLTVHYQDPHPGEMIPLLPKADFEHVETFSIIFARRNKQFRNQIFEQWSMMQEKTLDLKLTIYNYANSPGAKWTVVRQDYKSVPIAYVGHGSLTMSAFWMLKRISTLSRV